MRLVISDTGPVNYLILIGHIDILPRLFAKVVLPSAVQHELSNPLAPPLVRRWISDPPVWLEIVDVPAATLSTGLHKGEAEAIALAVGMQADLLLIDDRRAAVIAKKQGLRITGTLGLLDLAAERGLLDFADSIRKLENTTFRRPAALMKTLLDRHGRLGNR